MGNTWQPATLQEVETLLAKEVDNLHPQHRAFFERIRVPLRAVPVSKYPGESVFVVAEYEGQILYYSDVEDGWELELQATNGGIEDRGCNQFELSHLMWHVLGDPEKLD